MVSFRLKEKVLNLRGLEAEEEDRLGAKTDFKYVNDFIFETPKPFQNPKPENEKSKPENESKPETRNRNSEGIISLKKIAHYMPN